MSDFTCPKCNIVFKRKSTLLSHLNKKKSCVYNEQSINCIFCLKSFVKQSNLSRHLNICKKKINEIENLKIKNKELENEIEKIKNDKIVVQNITINNTINNTVNNNVQNVLVYNDYGKEDLSQVNLHEILEHKADVIPKFLYDLHCSIDRPENHNVGIKSLKRYQAHVRLNGEWFERNKKEVLTELLNKITKHISDQHYEDCKTLGVKQANLLYSNALKEMKVIDPNEDRYMKAQYDKILNDIEYVIHSNKTRIFSETQPIIKKREKIKALKRIDL